MKLTNKQANELISRAKPDVDGHYSKDEFISILTC